MVQGSGAQTPGACESPGASWECISNLGGLWQDLGLCMANYLPADALWLVSEQQGVNGRGAREGSSGV